MKKLLKKTILALMVSAILVSMTACGEEASSGADSSVVSEANVTPITAEDFKELLLTKVAFEGDMTDCTKLADYPMDAHGIKAELYSSYVYLEVSDTTNSYETIIVFHATSNDNCGVIKEKLDGYINGLKAQFTNYNATIIEMVNNSVVKAEGDKVYLIISPNVKEIEDTVKANLKSFN